MSIAEADRPKSWRSTFSASTGQLNDTVDHENFFRVTHLDQWMALQSSDQTPLFSFIFGIHTGTEILPHRQTRIIHPLSPFMASVHFLSNCTFSLSRKVAASAGEYMEV
jgi:hypothetical protein